MKNLFIKTLAIIGIILIALTFILGLYLAYSRELPLAIKVFSALLAATSAYNALKYLKHAVEHAQGKRTAPKWTAPVFMIAGPACVLVVTLYLAGIRPF
jgi:hypothetical protein